MFTLYNRYTVHVVCIYCLSFSAVDNFRYISSVADPHHLYADPDPACHFDADPDPAFHFDADPDPTFHFDADSDPSF